MSAEKSPEWASPENFSMVFNDIYRSSFPRPENFEFLRSLNLKSVLVLIPEPYPEENVRFVEENGIRFFQVGMPGNKEPFINVSHETITRALEIVLNPENHPLLIHCNRGKHRTGCLVGCLRRLQDWSLTMIFDEYRRFAFPKSRPLDQQLIELFDDSEIYQRALENKWLPLKW
uniref:diphosphoinositol-polyphosphate diphosphatase n=1 Tax=Blastobotrys adeninivorans TaxID=409370 RepID=A0A060T8Y7_BLAAD